VTKASSAGLLLHRVNGEGVLQVLLVHMGGPLWRNKNQRAWSVPKGEYGPGEDPLEVARREFTEELGHPPPPGDWDFLGEVRQAGGKVVTVWALEADFDTTSVSSNTFSMEWPRGSGRIQEFPEVDRAEWHDSEAARDKLVAGQVALVDLLVSKVGLPRSSG